LTSILASAGTACAWILTVSASGGHEITSTATGQVEVFRAYIDPGVAGFVIVTVLGFISSVGYLARSYVGRMRRLFRTDETSADDEARDDSDADGKGEDC